MRFDKEEEPNVFLSMKLFFKFWISIPQSESALWLFYLGYRKKIFTWGKKTHLVLIYDKVLIKLGVTRQWTMFWLGMSWQNFMLLVYKMLI